MNKDYKVMWSGIIIQGIVFVYMLICVFAQKEVPGFVPLLILLGTFITVMESFTIRTKMDMNKKKAIGVIVFFILLVIIMLILTLH